jgi:protein-L-isoaspartate O-methyltransferase
MYGAALEALDLQENSSMSFLNVGSGTGYMNSIVAVILGPYSTNYGIEIHQDVVDHCEGAIARWKDVYLGKLPHFELIHGNALNISMDEGEALVGFDRIYVGASISRNNLSALTSLLKPGGILVGPGKPFHVGSSDSPVITALMCVVNLSVGDELVKVVRRRQTTRGVGSNNDFSHNALSGVRFSALLTAPVMKTVLPSRVWSPSIHQAYPESFRKSSKALMLCSYAPYVQPFPDKTKVEHQVNLAATLPNVIWMEILSYTHHNWFDPPDSHGFFLQQRLLEEQESARKANQARIEAEARCHVAQRERDIYRLLARRWQVRLQSLLNRRQRVSTLDTEEIEEVGTHITAPMEFHSSGSDDGSSDDDSDGDSDMDVDDSEYVAYVRDDGQDDISIEGTLESDGFNFLSQEYYSEIPDLGESETSVADSFSASPSSVNGMMMAQSPVRTVSISEEA